MKPVKLVIFLLLVLSRTVFLPAIFLPSGDEISARIEAMDWKTSGTISLKNSHSTFVLPEGNHAVTGADARQLICLFRHDNDPAVEAVVTSPDLEMVISFEYLPADFAELEEIRTLDNDSWKNELEINLEKWNCQAQRLGNPKIEFKKWIREPQFDVATNTFSSAYEFTWSDNDPTPWIEVLALHLGRNGYERIYSNHPADQFSLDLFDQMILGHRFDRRYRFADHWMVDAHTDKEAKRIG